MKAIGFILPVYNEEEIVYEFYNQLKKTTDQLDQYSFNFCFINDGSTDSTFEKLTNLHNQDSRVTVVNFSRNFGQQAALLAGIDHITADAAIVMDTDLQDPPDVCIELIKKWEDGYDIVYAKRSERHDNLPKRATASVFYRILNRLSDIDIPNDTGDFRLLDKKVVEKLRDMRERNRYFRGLVSYTGFNQTGVFFQRQERFAGETKYSFGKLLKLSVDAITGFSTIPLQIITRLGLLVSILGFIGILIALTQRLFFPDYTVSGWTTLIMAILFVGGVQIFMLGILGSYIGRIYIEVQNRPIYIVSSVYQKNDTSKNS